MKYAFDMTTQRNFSTGEMTIDKEKAFDVYNSFVENMELPDVEKPASNELMESYNQLVKAIIPKLEALKQEEQ